MKIPDSGHLSCFFLWEGRHSHTTGRKQTTAHILPPPSFRFHSIKAGVALKTHLGNPILILHLLHSVHPPNCRGNLSCDSWEVSLSLRQYFHKCAPEFFMGCLGSPSRVIKTRIPSAEVKWMFLKTYTGWSGGTQHCESHGLNWCHVQLVSSLHCEDRAVHLSF